MNNIYSEKYIQGNIYKVKGIYSRVYTHGRNYLW